MKLLEQILNCSDGEIEKIITDAISKCNDKTDKVDMIGFLPNLKYNNIHKGFIPLNTRIKYSKTGMEDYSLNSTDFYFEFAHFIRKNNINSGGKFVCFLELFIDTYFGYPSKTSREYIFNDIAWQNSETDEEYFTALDNNKIGDLKGKGAAMCTERTALATELLSLFGFDTYYCIGCINNNGNNEAHAFNIVKRKNDYALLDYSMTVPVYNQNGIINRYYPFIGIMSNEEFQDFINNGIIKSFANYYYNQNEKVMTDTKRMYVVGAYEIEIENKHVK